MVKKNKQKELSEQELIIILDFPLFHTKSKIYIHPTNLWLNVPYQSIPWLDAFGSHHQASGKFFPGYLAALLGRMHRVHLNFLARTLLLST